MTTLIPQRRLILGSCLYLTLSLILTLILAPLQPASAQKETKIVHTNSLENDSSIPKPRNVTCYECADELVPEFEEKRGLCSHFRELWVMFARSKRKSSGKSEYRNELLTVLQNRFGRNCSNGVEDCFYTRPVDVRIAGYESRGCGSGPPVIDAEPGEGCAQEQIKYGEEIIDVLNCVCEDDPSSSKGYCNDGRRAGGGGGIGSMLGLLGAGAALLLRWDTLL